MKKLVWAFALVLLTMGSLSAQKVGLVDMQYILSKHPAHETVNKTMEQMAEKVQKQVKQLEQKAQKLYQSYQDDAARLSGELKRTREQEIIATEKEAYELKRKFFSPEGEFAKKREELMKPIEEKIWTALKALAEKEGYQIIIDRSSSKIVYADPSIDMSAHVLSLLGVK